MIYLIIGTCGVGKTWVMKKLMGELNISSIYTYTTGTYTYLNRGNIILLGRYDGTIFEGSDRLSMSVMASNDKIEPVFKKAEFVIGEGDRFTNKTFIERFKPTILKINGNGEQGRMQRGSSQTERHLKSITTRVNNIQADMEFDSSTTCFNYILDQIKLNAKKSISTKNT